MSQLVASCYVSANASRYFLSMLSSIPRAVSKQRDDCTAVHKSPASPGAITSNAVTIAVVALVTNILSLVTQLFPAFFRMARYSLFFSTTSYKLVEFFTTYTLEINMAAIRRLTTTAAFIWKLYNALVVVDSQSSKRLQQITAVTFSFLCKRPSQ